MTTHRTVSIERAKRRLAVAGLLLAAAGLVSAAIYGQSGPAPSSATLPYQGYLEDDGAPAEGTKLVKVCLYRARDATDCAWTESHTVQLSAGRFSVSLGSENSIDDLLRGGGDLYLGLSVDDVENGKAAGRPIALGGRQLLASAPYARRGAPGKDFVVDGNVKAGSAAIEGSVAAGSLSVSHALSAESASLTGSFSAASASVTHSLTAGSISAGDIASLQNKWGVEPKRRDFMVKSACENANEDGITEDMCEDGTYLCGLRFKHPCGQNASFQEGFSLVCCPL